MSAKFDETPIDRTLIPQELLDATHKSRASVFNWRGQFTPEFAEAILRHYARPGLLVADPFVGSGSTVFEAARQSCDVFGCDVNPAAVAMARIAGFVSLTVPHREAIFSEVEDALLVGAPELRQGVFSFENRTQYDGESNRPCVLQSLKEASKRSSSHDDLCRVVAMLHFEQTKPTVVSTVQSLRNLKSRILSLPASSSVCEVQELDARRTGLPDGSVDFALTSPPYINVFNYHQNYRRGVEAWGRDVLSIAPSEIGANRKNRANRFLTVTQYAVDMAMVMIELNRYMSTGATAVFVLGRTSSVMGTSFQNGRLLAMIAQLAGFDLSTRQERKYRNKFGTTIYEDVLHLRNREMSRIDPLDIGRCAGRLALESGLSTADPKVMSDLAEAVKNVPYAQPSPFTDHAVALPSLIPQRAPATAPCPASRIAPYRPSRGRGLVEGETRAEFGP